MGESKQDSRRARALVLWAASFTGATWMSFVLGSHQKVFSLGNIKRAIGKLQTDPRDVCVVHRRNCEFWPAFVAKWDPGENLLVQLADFTGCHNIVVNNPRLRGGRSVINDKRVEVVQFAIQRDLRALAASYLRKNPGTGIEQAVQDFLLTAAETIETDVNRKGVIVIDHGVASTDQMYLLDKIRQGTRLSYDVENLRFWEHDYHVVSSNAGTVGTVKSYQNMTESHRQKYYEDFVERLRTTDGANISFFDQRWRQELTRYDLFVVDRCVGRVNERLGYGRDEFTQTESGEFTARLDARLSEPGLEGIRRHLQLQGAVYANFVRAARQGLRTLAEKYC